MDPDSLKDIPMFRRSDKALETVQACSRPRNVAVKRAKRLGHEGEYSYDLIVIETGTAGVKSRAADVVGARGPGDRIWGDR